MIHLKNILKSHNIPEKENGTIEYPSATIMLDISRNEYERERERCHMLDNKASLFVSAALAILTILIPIIPFSELVSFYRLASKIQIALITIVLVLLLISSVLFIIGIYNLCKVIMIKKYSNVNFDNLNDETILKANENKSKRALLDHYNTILNENFKINNEKAEQIKIGFKYSILSFVFLFVSTISLLILIGG